MIDQADVGAIIDLERIARAHGISVMIIGAGARLLRFRLETSPPRTPDHKRLGLRRPDEDLDTV